MKNLTFTPFLLVVIIAAIFTHTVDAARYRVTDEQLSFYSDPDRTNRIGYLHAGDEFESTGEVGSLLIFDYHGRKAYIASYCCKEIVGETPLPERVESNVTEQPQTRSVGTGRKKKSDVPPAVAYLVAIIMFLGVIVGLWTIFGHGSCERFFDNQAGTYVTRCPKLMHFRPLILWMLAGITFNMTQSIIVTIAVAGCYEAILLAFRAKRWHSLRAAIVEAVYLLLYGIGAIAFCVLLLAFAFMASGGTSNSGSSDDDKAKSSRPRSCSRCRHMNWNLTCPYSSSPNANTCSHYSET